MGRQRTITGGPTSLVELMTEPTPEACPICHRTVGPDENTEWVPVCPLVYPAVKGLLCHQVCLEEGRR